MQAHAQFQHELGSHHEGLLILASDYAASPVCTDAKPTSNAALSDTFLTVRETEIMQLLGKGFSAKGIARSFDISPGTVKWHVRNIYEKLGASSREDALAKARQRKMIPL